MQQFFNKFTDRKEIILGGLVILIFIAFRVFAAYSFSDDDSFGFECPNDFNTPEEYTNSLAKWIKEYTEKYPEATAEDMMAVRDKLIEENECERPNFTLSESASLIGDEDNFDVEKLLNSIKQSFLQGGVVGENGKYKKVLVNDNPIEEPVSIIYSDKVSPIYLKSDKEIDEIISTSRIKNDEFEVQNWKEQINSQISEFGQIARQYLPNDGITGYYEADIDNDGVKEKLVTICGLGANHCSDYSQVIKNNKVIFSVKLYDSNGYGAGIIPAKNGFYVEWTDEGSFQNVGLCCPVNHYKTSFLFQKGKFIPIQQWKVPHVWKKVVDD